jgi:hypothetical protein
VKVSPAKLRANRRIALRSTGPCTAGGNARSRNNALRHGLAAEDDAESEAAISALAELMVNEAVDASAAHLFAEAQVDLEAVAECAHAMPPSLRSSG